MVQTRTTGLSSDSYKQAGKRRLDILLAGLLFLLCLPIMGVVAMLVRITLGSPVVFKQRRPGRNGHPFTIHKFRTMSEARDDEGRLLPAARRVTRLGRLLRRTSIDELPELLDVMRGDMSLVGPRPLLFEHLALYSDAQRRRLEVRPGITGWAQVNGRNAISFEQKCAMDVWYVERMSFGLDARILWLTILRVLCMRGIDGPAQIVTGPMGQ